MSNLEPLKPLPLSVIYLTFNAETYIEASLRTVAGWVGEIFVVDSGSTDTTLEIVRRYTDQVVCHQFENYAQQRNWAQKNLLLSHVWVLHLDADESVSPELQVSLREFFESGFHEHVSGVLVARRVVFLGKWIRHGGMYPVYHHRIFRRDKGHCEERLYDQHFVVQGKTQRIAGDLIDFVSPDLDTWMRSHLKWSMLETRQQLADGNIGETKNVITPKLMGTPIEKRRWARMNIYSRAPLFVRSIGYFFYRYFLRLGFLDGVEGMIFHILQGFWFRFYIDAKLWEARRKSNQEMTGV